MRKKNWLAALMALVLSLCLACPVCAETGNGAEDDIQPTENAAEAETGEEKLDYHHLSVDDFKDGEVRSEKWLNVLLLGTDVRNAKEYGRTDSMILLSVNAERGLAKLTSFMRDTWVSIPGRKSKAKLNAACVYGGPQLTMRTLNEYFDLGIDYYVLVNLSGMAEMIDQLGGLRLDVTEAERKALNKGLFNLSSLSGMEKLEQSGEQVLLNGNQAVAFSRIRRIDTDFQRTERQRTVLTTIARRLQQEDPLSVIGVISKMMPFVETNLSMRQILTLASVGLQLNLDDVTQLRVPIDGTYKAGMYSGTWCIRADMDENRHRVHMFIYGKD